MSRVSNLLIAAASVAVISGTAFAQDVDGDATVGEEPAAISTDPTASTTEGTPAPDGTTPAAAGMEAGGGASTNGLLLGKGKIRIEGETAVINLSADSVAKPFSLAPAVYYGVNDNLTIGITHTRGTTMWSPGAGLSLGSAGAPGICLSGESNGCAKVYNNLGIDALFGLAAGKMSAAVHGGLDFLTLSDTTLALRAGVLGKYDIAPKVALTFDPSISIGLNKRDAGNKESLNVPVYLWLVASPQLSAYVMSGIAGPLSGFGDAYTIPVGVGASYTVSPKLTAGVDFDFINLAGKGSSADFRVLGLRVAYAL